MPMPATARKSPGSVSWVRWTGRVGKGTDEGVCDGDAAQTHEGDREGSERRGKGADTERSLVEVSMQQKRAAAVDGLPDYPVVP